MLTKGMSAIFFHSLSRDIGRIFRHRFHRYRRSNHSLWAEHLHQNHTDPLTYQWQWALTPLHPWLLVKWHQIGLNKEEYTLTNNMQNMPIELKLTPVLAGRQYSRVDFCYKPGPLQKMCQLLFLQWKQPGLSKVDTVFVRTFEGVIIDF